MTSQVFKWFLPDRQLSISFYFACQALFLPSHNRISLYNRKLIPCDSSRNKLITIHATILSYQSNSGHSDHLRNESRQAGFGAQDLCSQRGLHPQECFSIGSFFTATVLTFLITFKQEAFYLHIAQGPTNYVSYPKCMCKFLQSNNIPWFTAGTMS